jgi:hypothetical protein
MGNPINNKYTCTTIVPANCVKWPLSMTLAPIELCEGDSIVDVIIKSVNLSQDILASIDLSLIDMSCLADCNECGIVCDDDITIVNLFNCLFKEHCELVTIVEGLTTTSSLSGLLNVDLTCTLGITKTSVPSIITNDFIIQQALNASCVNNGLILGLTNDISDIQADITNIYNTCCTTTTGGIPSVNPDSCGIITTTTAVNIAVQQLLVDYCSLRSLITSSDYSDLATNLNPINACAISINAELALSGTGSPGQPGNQVGEALTVEDTLGDMWNVLCKVSNNLYTLANTTAVTCDFELTTSLAPLNVTITYTRSAVVNSFVVTSATTTGLFSLPTGSVLNSAVNNVPDTTVTLSSSTSCATVAVTNYTSVCKRVVMDSTYDDNLGVPYEWYIDGIIVGTKTILFSDLNTPHELGASGFESSSASPYSCGITLPSTPNVYTFSANLLNIKNTINLALVTAGVLDTQLTCVSGDMTNSYSTFIFNTISGISISLLAVRKQNGTVLGSATIAATIPASCECCNL